MNYNVDTSTFRKIRTRITAHGTQKPLTNER